jgi:hypothetical protein
LRDNALDNRPIEHLTSYSISRDKKEEEDKKKEKKMMAGQTEW